MRSLGMIGLVLALLVVGVLVQKQMRHGVGAVSAVPVASPAPGAAGAPVSTVRAQSEQIQQQVRQQLDAATQPRPMPVDAN